MSGKSSSFKEPESPTVVSANNNDINNMDNSSNSIYSGSFPIDDYYLLSNEIIYGAICLHKKLYGNLVVPYHFIGYYFKVFGQINSPRCNYLNNFLILFHNKINNVSNAISIFNKLYIEDCEIKHIKKNSIFGGLKEGYYLEAFPELIEEPIYYSPNAGVNLKNAVADIRNFINEIDFKSQQSGFKADYLDFLSKTTTTNETLQIGFKPHNPNQSLTLRDKKVITPPKAEKEEKVSSLSLPKLKTGRFFPTSFTHSRIDSAHYATAFLEGDRTYNLLRKYKFTQAKYTDGFEEKRKALFETDKTSFDLF